MRARQRLSAFSILSARDMGIGKLNFRYVLTKTTTHRAKTYNKKTSICFKMICSLTGIRLSPGTYTVLEDKKYLTCFLTAWTREHEDSYETASSVDKKYFLKRELLGILERCPESLDMLYAKVLLAASIREDAMFASLLAHELFLFTRLMMAEPGAFADPDDAFDNFSEFSDLLYSVFGMLIQEDEETCLLTLNAYGKSSATSTLVNAILGMSS